MAKLVSPIESPHVYAPPFSDVERTTEGNPHPQWEWETYQFTHFVVSKAMWFSANSGNPITTHLNAVLGDCVKRSEVPVSTVDDIMTHLQTMFGDF